MQQSLLVNYNYMKLIVNQEVLLHFHNHCLLKMSWNNWLYYYTVMYFQVKWLSKDKKKIIADWIVKSERWIA